MPKVQKAYYIVTADGEAGPFRSREAAKSEALALRDEGIGVERIRTENVGSGINRKPKRKRRRRERRSGGDRRGDRRGRRRDDDDFDDDDFDDDFDDDDFDDDFDDDDFDDVEFDDDDDDDDGEDEPPSPTHAWFRPIGG